MASTGISSAYTNSYAALQKPTPPTQASQLNKQLLGLGATAALAVAAGVGTAGLSYGSNFKDVFQHETIEKKLANEGKPQWLSMEETIQLAEALKAEDPEGWQEKLMTKNALNNEERIGVKLDFVVIHAQILALRNNVTRDALEGVKTVEGVLEAYRKLPKVDNNVVKQLETIQREYNQLKQQGLQGQQAPPYNLHTGSLRDERLVKDVLPEFKNALDERIAQAHVKHFEGFFKPWTNDVKQLKEQGLRALANRTEQARHNGYWYGGMVALLGLIFVEWQSSKQKNNYQTNY